MPNYCNNSLSIYASRNTLNKIRSFIQSDDNKFDFDKIIPMPDYIYRGNLGSEEQKIYGKNNWYDWSYENWGTKWNSLDVECDEFEDSLEYSFYTAWCSCEPVIKALAAMYPDARIDYSYYESGDCFCGKREYENGEMNYYVNGEYQEIYYDGEDYKKEQPSGIHYSENNRESMEMDNVIRYDFHYLDVDEERTIEINGFCVDGRNVKDRFYW